MGRDKGGGVAEAFGMAAAFVRQHLLPQLFQFGILFFRSQAGLEQKKFVTAYPAHFAADILQGVRYFNQIAVALLMPKGIVAVFQVIHIYEGEKEGGSLLQPLLHLFGGITPVI